MKQPVWVPVLVQYRSDYLCITPAPSVARGYSQSSSPWRHGSGP